VAERQWMIAANVDAGIELRASYDP
jgi:hypothetical protein